jgi:hypothetical protein
MRGAPSERKILMLLLADCQNAHGLARATVCDPQHCITEPVRLYMRGEVSTTAVGSLLPNYVNARL